MTKIKNTREPLKKVYLNDKPMPTIEVLDLDLLKIDDYQREATPEEVDKIIREFDIHKVQVIRVSLRNGIYYIFDGQHTKLGLVGVGITRYYCEVHRGLTYKEEAALFSDQNKIKRMLTSKDIFNSKIKEENKDHLELDCITKKYGFKIECKNNKELNLTPIHAVSNLLKIKKKLGLDSVDTALRLISQTWPGEEKPVETNMLWGVCGFVKSMGENLNEKLFVKKLSLISPEKISREIKGRSDLNLELRSQMEISKYYKKRK